MRLNRGRRDQRHQAERCARWMGLPGAQIRFYLWAFETLGNGRGDMDLAKFHAHRDEAFRRLAQMSDPFAGKR